MGETSKRADSTSSTFGNTHFWHTSGAPWGALALGALLLPVWSAAHGSQRHEALVAGVGVTVALLAAVGARRVARGRALAAPACALVALGGWLIGQLAYPPSVWQAAVLVGIGVGWAVPEQAHLRRPATLAAGALGLLAVLGARLTCGRETGLGLGVALALTGALLSLLGRGSWHTPTLRRVGASALSVALISLLLTCWIGANTSGARWFGDLRSHGPPAGDMVAITFDDGPNDPFSLRIAAILDSYGIKATFFTVGKALDARPDISRALLDDGQLLGNHSYQHDNYSWLDPRYPELAQTQAAFQHNLGVCPAFYRPPHGQHTPFIAHQAHERSMTMVTWSVSAGDWATTDGDLVAQRVLAKAGPGSIILLHDGIDGDVTSDRSVILRALPLIIDGLQQRGLRPVTLDVLLGTPGYVPC